MSAKKLFFTPLFRFAERIAIGAGVLLLLAWSAARVDGAMESRRAIERFDATPQVADTEAGPGATPATAADTSLWSPGRIEAWRAALHQEAGAVLGVLAIPSIGLEVPLFEGISEVALNRGVGRIPGTAGLAEGGNVGIAGHRDGFFRGLKDLGPGDRIELRTAGGLQAFVIDSTRIVAPEDVEVLAPTPGPALTLVTCYPFYYVGPAPQRFIVRAVQDGSPRQGGSAAVSK